MSICASLCKRKAQTDDRFITFRCAFRMMWSLLLLLQSNITEQIKESVSYSIIADCTLDISHREQLSLTIRYVACKDETIQFIIVERSITFQEVSDKSDQGIADLLLRILAGIGLRIADMREQGYENGSNMKGKNVDVNKIISDINPRAIFVPCSSHSLNLVLKAAANTSGAVFDYFSTVQEVYNILSKSTDRWAILQKHAESSKAIHVKSLSENRWSSRHAAIDFLVVVFDAGNNSSGLLRFRCSTCRKTKNGRASPINGTSREICVRQQISRHN